MYTVLRRLHKVYYTVEPHYSEHRYSELSAKEKKMRTLVGPTLFQRHFFVKKPKLQDPRMISAIMKKYLRMADKQPGKNSQPPKL